MPQLVLIIGAALIALGGGAYWAAAMVSPTALIPALLGVLLVALYLLGLRQGLRRSATLASLVIALLGLLGSIPGVVNLAQSMGGTELSRPRAAITQTVMAIFCAIVVAATAHAALRNWRQERRTSRAWGHGRRGV